MKYDTEKISTPLHKDDTYIVQDFTRKEIQTRAVQRGMSREYIDWARPWPIPGTFLMQTIIIIRVLSNRRNFFFFLTWRVICIKKDNRKGITRAHGPPQKTHPIKNMQAKKASVRTTMHRRFCWNFIDSQKTEGGPELMALKGSRNFPRGESYNFIDSQKTEWPELMDLKGFTNFPQGEREREREHSERGT